MRGNIAYQNYVRLTFYVDAEWFQTGTNECRDRETGQYLLGFTK
jgi:hypothetical protein